MQPPSQPRHDPYYDPPPTLEYLGVAPAWRIVALFALVGVAVLLVLIILLFLALAGAGVNTAVTFPPAPPMVAPAAPLFDPADPDIDEAVPAGQAVVPDQQDLRPAGTFPVPGEEAEARPATSPRGEFLRLGQRVWDSPEAVPPRRVLVSPDGLFMAYHNGANLMAGSLGLPNAINENAMWNNPAFGGGMAGGMAAPGMGVPVRTSRSSRERPPTVFAWRADSSALYWTNGGGRVLNYEPKQARVFGMAIQAEWAAPVPGQGAFVVVRPQLRPRFDASGTGPTEIVVVDSTTGAVRRSLISDDRNSWRLPVVSPDGKRLAIVSDRGQAASEKNRWRIFVIDIDAEKTEPKPVSPAAALIDSVVWSNDGQLLLYSRSQSPLPFDHRRLGPPGEHAACDLFELDVAAGKETRLSRGGGFYSVNLTSDDQLVFLAETPQLTGAPLVQMVRLPLRAVRTYLEEQAEAVARSAALWTTVADETMAEAGWKDGASVTAELLAKLDQAFRKAHRGHFKGDAPSTAAALDSLRAEVQAAELPPATRKRYELILGAVEGEYLRRRPEGASWQLGAAAPPGAAVSGETLLAYAVNPFRSLDRAADSTAPPSLAEVVYRAAGRPLVLATDPAAAKPALDKATGPAIDALAKADGAEADKAAQELVKRHERNFALLRHVVEVLCHKERYDTARDLLQRPATLPPDPRLHNLLGVALLPTDKNAAIKSFQDAIRCDLTFGPAYLNLAQAYWESGQITNARQCLRLYLRRAPKGELVADAQRRLSVYAEAPVAGAPAIGGP